MSESVGKALKRMREERNLSLDEVSRATKIRKEFLIAIEDDRYEELPGRVFARGFLRSYGDYLGGDGQGIAMRAIRVLDGHESPERSTRVDEASGARVSWPLMVVALFGIVALVAFLATGGGG